MGPKKKPALSGDQWKATLSTELSESLQSDAAEDLKHLLLEEANAYQRWLESASCAKEKNALRAQCIVPDEKAEDLTDERPAEVVKSLKEVINKLFSLEVGYFSRLSPAVVKKAQATAQAVEKLNKEQMTLWTGRAVGEEYNKFQRCLPLNSLHAFCFHRHRQVRARGSFTVADLLDSVWAWVAAQLNEQLNALFPARQTKLAEADKMFSTEGGAATKKGALVRKIKALDEKVNKDEDSSNEEDDEEDDEYLCDDLKGWKFIEDWECRDRNSEGNQVPRDIGAMVAYFQNMRNKRPNTLKLKYKPFETAITKAPKGVLKPRERLVVLWKFSISTDVESGGLFDVTGEVVIRSTNPKATTETLVGIISGNLIYRDSLRHSMQMINNSEENSNEMGAFAAELFTNHAELQYSLRSNVWGKSLDRGNIFLLDGVVLDSSVREKGLGAVLLREALIDLAARPHPKMENRVGCVFVKPQPWAQGSRMFSGSPNDLEFIQNEILVSALQPAVTKKLELLFASNGFARLCDGSEWFACVPRGDNIAHCDTWHRRDVPIDDKTERTHPVWDSTTEKNYGKPFKVTPERNDAEDNGVRQKWATLKCSEIGMSHVDPLYNTIGLNSLTLRYLAALSPKVCTCGHCARPLLSSRTSVALYVAIDMLRDQKRVLEIPNAKSTPATKEATLLLANFVCDLFMLPRMCQERTGNVTPTAKGIRMYGENHPQLKAFFRSGCRIEHMLAYMIKDARDEVTNNIMEGNGLTNDDATPAPNPATAASATDDVRTTAAEAEVKLKAPREAPELFYTVCDRDYLWHELPSIFYDDGFVPSFECRWDAFEDSDDESGDFFDDDTDSEDYDE